MLYVHERLGERRWIDGRSAATIYANGPDSPIQGGITLQLWIAHDRQSGDLVRNHTHEVTV